MPIKFGRCVVVGSACVDIRPSPKTDVLVAYTYIHTYTCLGNNDFVSLYKSLAMKFVVIWRDTSVY